MKLFWPPCDKNTSTPAARMSACGTDTRHSALGGTSKSARDSGCGPDDKTINGPSSGPAAPKASKAPRQTARQSCPFVSPRGAPVDPPDTGVVSQVSRAGIMVPMLTRTTPRPALRATRTRSSASDALRAAPWRANGPTYTNFTPSSEYLWASSGPIGSWRLSIVVTKLVALLAKGMWPIGSDATGTHSPYASAIRAAASTAGRYPLTSESTCSGLRPKFVSISTMNFSIPPGPARVSSPTLGTPTAWVANFTSAQSSGL
mmetsp:Transcript_73839/g.225834  ORF Transcript_73839/g.225834 Transcript_73839/m.225834 type:complete len:260 (+) Transcript_73839:341-1120(+)